MGTRDDSPWTEAEEVIVARAYSGGKGLLEISRNHHRSVLLLEEKLIELGQINRIAGVDLDQVAACAPGEDLGDPMLSLLKHTTRREAEEADQVRSALEFGSELESLEQDYAAGLLKQGEYERQNRRLMALIEGGEAARAWLQQEEAERAAERKRLEAGGDGRWSELEDDPWEGEE